MEVEPELIPNLIGNPRTVGQPVRFVHCIIHHTARIVNPTDAVIEIVERQVLCLTATGANTPDVIELTSDPTSINGIVAGKKVSGKGIYSVSGTLLRPTSDTAGLPAGLYIIDGKKVAVK